MNTFTASAKQKPIPVLRDIGNRSKTFQTENNNGPDPSSLQKASVPQIKKRLSKRSKKGVTVLQDVSDKVSDVQPENINIVTDVSSKVKPMPQANEQFKVLIDQGKYKEVFMLGMKMRMKSHEFLKQLCPVVKTLEQYKGIVDHLKRHKMLYAFYVHGDMGVVREVIISDPWIYYYLGYVESGDLEAALLSASRNGYHERAINLLKIRGEMAIEKDEQRKREGLTTRFEIFVNWFLIKSVPLKDEMTLRRFLNLCVDELRDEHPNVFHTLCQELVNYLKCRHNNYWRSTGLLIDLIGQPWLLTSISFVRGFLHEADDEDRANFIKYGWREAIEEGLKTKYPCGGEYLWQLMKEKRPARFVGAYPPTVATLDAALKHFPTKREKEELWGRENVPDFSEKLDELITDEILPKVIIKIIIAYADPRPTWLDV